MHKINPAPVALVDMGYMTSSTSLSSFMPSLASPVKLVKRKKVSRKGDTTKSRLERKRLNMGIMQEIVKSLPNCPFKCHTKSSKDERQQIWEDFRTIESLDNRYRYLARLVTIKSPSRLVVSKEKRKMQRNIIATYYLKVHEGEDDGNVVLCKECFLCQFNLTPSKVRTLLNKKVANGQGSNLTYQRGKRPPANKTPEDQKEQAELFLLAVPAYESHYGRADSDKKYLPDYHTKTSLFEDFKSAFPNNKVNYFTFCKIFKGLNLSIKGKSTDTCKTCDELHILIKSAVTESDKVALTSKQSDHWYKWQKAVAEKQKDASIASKDSSKRVVTYDLQQILPTPFLTTSVAFYSRQLSTFNLTIYDIVSKLSAHNVWNEAMARRGANEINSCLFDYGLSLPSHVNHLIKYSDRCPGQNCNIQTIIADLFLLQNSSSLNVIDTKYLVSGHTHMECDSAHAMIEKYKKKTKEAIECPDDWIELIRQTSNKFTVNKMNSQKFLDFTSNLKETLVYRKKNVKNEPWKFTDIQWIRTEKENPGKFKYKSTYDENEAFKEVSLLRKVKDIKEITLTAERIHATDNSNPISKEKKQDLVNLLKYISPHQHPFYHNLIIEEETKKNKKMEE